jgi:hypothetical protein
MLYLSLAAISTVTAIPSETTRDEQQHALAVALLQSEAEHPCAVFDWNLHVQSGFQGQIALLERVFKDRHTQLHREQGSVIMSKVRVQVEDFLKVIHRTGKRIHDHFRQFGKNLVTMRRLHLIIDALLIVGLIVLAIEVVVVVPIVLKATCNCRAQHNTCICCTFVVIEI